MPRTPRTRERLLDAALDLFIEQGFEGTTITEVERRVGLTPGTGSFYRHFRSKDELLRAAVEREVERAMGEITATPRPVDDPVGELAAVLAALRQFDRILRLVLAEGDRVPELREVAVTALQGPGEQLSWEDSPLTVLRVAALAGYHVFSTVQGRPFQDAPEQEFLAALAALIPTP